MEDKRSAQGKRPLVQYFAIQQDPSLRMILDLKEVES